MICLFNRLQNNLQTNTATIKMVVFKASNAASLFYSIFLSTKIWNFLKPSHKLGLFVSKRLKNDFFRNYFPFTKLPLFCISKWCHAIIDKKHSWNKGTRIQMKICFWHIWLDKIHRTLISSLLVLFGHTFNEVLSTNKLQNKCIFEQTNEQTKQLFSYRYLYFHFYLSFAISREKHHKQFDLRFPSRQHQVK